jgi:type III secretion protein Q
VLALATAPGPLDLRRWTGRRVSRLEALFARRASLVGELRALVGGATEALTKALSVPVGCVARLGSSADPRYVQAAPRALCLLHLEGLGVDALLALELRFVVALVAQLAGAPPPTTPVLGLTVFERAVLAHLVLVALAGLRTRAAAERRWAPRFVGVVPGHHEADTVLGRQRVVGVELELRAGEQVGRASLLLPESAVQTLVVGFAEDAPRAGGAAREARFAFRPRVRCGVLWPGELGGLLPGNALLLPGLQVADGSCQGPLKLARRGIVLKGQLTGTGWTLGTVEPAPPMTEVTCVDPQLSSLPVELEVELGSVPITLAELSALGPGSIVPLQITPGDPVFLRAGDRRIARAELVDLEGEVAARVLDLGV